MRPAHEYELVARLAAQGLNRCEIARLSGIPRTTVRSWLQFGFHPRTKARGPCDQINVLCRQDLPSAQYAYLLGLYLGDGYLARTHRRNVFALCITCDVRYTKIIEQCEAAIAAIVPGRVGRRILNGGGCVDVYRFSTHWPHLFPQHGPGMKHTRRIGLEPWQQAIVDAHPEQLVRGLVHSDGCRVTNRVTRRWKSGAKQYEYLRYFFSNRSADIKRIFVRALDQLGVEWKHDGPFVVSVARRESVALLDSFVGPKR